MKREWIEQFPNQVLHVVCAVNETGRRCPARVVVWVASFSFGVTAGCVCVAHRGGSKLSRGGNCGDPRRNNAFNISVVLVEVHSTLRSFVESCNLDLD